MASTKELRRRIKSVKNTAQITKAMQMVSATKMRRAQNQTLQARPYSSTIEYTLSKVLNGSKDRSDLSHPLLLQNSSSKIGVVVLTSDKGLCGALNANLFRYIQSSGLDKERQVVYYTVGKKGRDFIVRSNRNLEADFESFEKIDVKQAIKVRKFLTASFLSNQVSQVFILYPHFTSALSQDAKFIQILPVEQVLSPASGNGSDFLYEPQKQVLLDYALIHHLDIQIYQALLETKASEHSARMIAMQNATSNAQDLVADLTLTYNQARQENITNELLEITSAQAALE